ncbi:MAG: hypothetical protein P1U77_29360, partial [Rubripirellula sp.]|nr:hypothetical protein [Rubripirellula sp.]
TMPIPQDTPCPPRQCLSPKTLPVPQDNACPQPVPITVSHSLSPTRQCLSPKTPEDTPGETMPVPGWPGVPAGPNSVRHN